MERNNERIRRRRELRQQQNNQPFRFWMPVGTDRKVLVLDEEPEFFRYEHALFNPDSNRNDIFIDCIDETDTCPACEQGDARPYYAMYLTVIDLEGYVNKNNEEVPWTRKLFVVKPSMQRQWVREFERSGSLRGKVFRIFRDNPLDPATGNMIELDLEEDPYTEDELAEFVRTYTDREGKEHEEDCSVPYDYDEIMPPMTAQQIAEVCGVEAAPTPGSREAEDADFDDDEEEEEVDAAADEEWEGEEEEEEDEEYGDEEEEEEDEEDEEDEEEDEEDFDEPPPPKRRARGARERGRQGRRAAEKTPAKRRTKRRAARR